MTTTPTAAARVSGTIKALEWETNFAAPDIPHSYATHGDDEDGWQISVCWRTCSEWLNDGQLFATEAAAKAAAQADYEARILAAIQPAPEPSAWGALQVIADIPSTMNGSFDHGLEVAYRAVEALFDNPPMITCTPTDPEPQPVAFGRQHFEPKRDSDHQPWDANPSSAGTVSVEAAAKVIVDAWDADTLPVNDPTPMLPAFIAALRALAGEGER